MFARRSRRSAACWALPAACVTGKKTSSQNPRTVMAPSARAGPSVSARTSLSASDWACALAYQEHGQVWARCSAFARPAMYWRHSAFQNFSPLLPVPGVKLWPLIFRSRHLNTPRSQIASILVGASLFASLRWRKVCRTDYGESPRYRGTEDNFILRDTHEAETPIRARRTLPGWNPVQLKPYGTLCCFRYYRASDCSGQGNR